MDSDPPPPTDETPSPTEAESPTAQSATNFTTPTETPESTGDVNSYTLPVSCRVSPSPIPEQSSEPLLTTTQDNEPATPDASMANSHFNVPPGSCSGNITTGSVILPSRVLDPQEDILLEFGFDPEDMEVGDEENDAILTTEANPPVAEMPPADPMAIDDKIEVILPTGAEPPIGPTFPSAPIIPWKYEETHPFTRHYGRTNLVLQGPPAKQMSQAQSLVGIQNFRNSTTEWLMAPLSPLRKIRKISKSPLNTISTLPQETGTIYIVKDKNGTLLILVPHQAEVVGPDRPDLHVVSISVFSVDKLNGECPDVNDYMVGDAVFVTRLAPRPRKTSKDIPTTFNTVHEGRPDNFWHVEEFYLLHREYIVADVVRIDTTKTGERLAAAAGLNIHVRIPTCDCRQLRHSGEGATAKIFTPLIQPGQFLPGLLSGDSKSIVAKAVVPHANRDTVLPTITEILDWNKEEETAYKKFETLFASTTEDLAKLWSLFTRFTFLGYSAVLAAVNKDKDLRTYHTKITQSAILRNRRVVHFDLFCCTCPPREAQWTRGTSFKIETLNDVLDFEVENATLRPPFLSIVAKATSCRTDVTNTVAAMKDEVVLVSQTFQAAEKAFSIFPKPDEFAEIPETANFKTFLKALYGGEKIQLAQHDRPRQIFPGQIQPSDEQWAYIHAVAYSTTPALVANSPFGVGKTYTIGITLLTAARESRGTTDIHVATSVTNAAAVDLAKTFDRVNQPPSDGSRQVSAVRYISDHNYDSQEPQKHSDIDFARLWPPLFEEFWHHPRRFQVDPLEFQALRYAASYYTQKRKAPDSLADGATPKLSCWATYLKLARPQVIIGTVASLLLAFQDQPDILPRIKTVQIDEASQFPLTSLIPIGACCPHARFALTGDIRQLDPYADLTIQRIKPITVGDILTRCSGRIPMFNISRVFRCPAAITEICSKLFYSRPLVPQRSRNEVFPINIDLHLDQNYPLHIIFTTGCQERLGSSLTNEEEEQLAAELIRKISRQGQPCCNAAVLSFYKAQAARTAVLDDLREVFVGTIDASQGQEFDLTIVTTSRSTPFTVSPAEDEFINDYRRINVALTRSRGVCILLLHENAYRSSRIWTDLVRKIPAAHRHSIASWRQRASRN